MASMSVSVVKGRGSIRHNNRDFIHDNVDPERTAENVIYKQQSLEDAYKELFQEEVDRYNENQRRADRQIDNYMEQVRNSKNGEQLFYENVVQIGNKDDCGIGTENAHKAQEVLDEYMKTFQERNPNLHVFNAVLHNDEATPHLHIDYIPVAHSYERGMQVRNSLDKALKEQGIEGKANKKENSTHNWQESEKKSLEEIMKKHDLERTPEKGIGRKHMTVDQYKAVAEQVQNAVKKMPEQIEASPSLMNKNKVTVTKSDLDALEERAKLSTLHETATRKIERGTKEEKGMLLRTLRAEENKAMMNRIKSDQELKEAVNVREKAEQMHQKAVQAYKNQATLNESFKELKKENELLKKENASLRLKFDDLRHSVDSTIQKATDGLQKQIGALEKGLRTMGELTVKLIKSMSWLNDTKDDLDIDEFYKVAKEYVKFEMKMLKYDALNDLIENVSGTDLPEKMKKELIPDYEKTKEILFKDGERGRGFYCNNGRFLGKEKDLPQLKKIFKKASFKDTTGTIPQLPKLPIVKKLGRSR